MIRLNPANPLLENLANNPPVWWKTLVMDKDIKTKPLLVIDRCEQAWIDKNRELINDKVSSIAYGTYYCGSVGSCDLEQREHKNRYLIDLLLSKYIFLE